MIWKNGIIHDCTIRLLTRYDDARGWLSEIFRHDELEENVHPAMAYISMTRPGVTRGPHEHLHQTDLFAFVNGSFRLYLWDYRNESPSYGTRQILDAGIDSPATVIVPPGVIHAYRNMGTSDALVINCPNQLYAGQQKMHTVDEIRWEERPDHNLILD
ncbi:MAG: dTDP-4-dehydrorhamnose 3,5-epimerase family protein [Bacteroidetes bacterium]|nr:dTDP-4-dehydrorhamnose 3,5-epimerase family protein [Bacteroidota bacterium]MCY4204831.1 dTDP-4-dehydrorhamnose 3,5-epimerase family protein [Bacteroidota bacterium]